MSLLIFLFIITTGFVFFTILQEKAVVYNPVFESFFIIVNVILLSIIIYLKIKKLTSSQILLGFIGLFAGIFSGILLTIPLLVLSQGLKENVSNLIFEFAFVVIISFGYVGALFGLKKAEKIKLSDILKFFKKEAIWEEPKVIDTNVLIDGRIADLIELGFIKGTVLVPRFVLKEIQYIADSPDPLRRAKGRRALDIIQKIQRTEKVKFEILDKDIPEIKEVDIKLVELCRALKAILVTNDSNLVKIAQIRGISVLNLNELAQAMRPPVLPGEVLKLFIVKEGKEADQGVAYLDDGTMVVVEEGKKYIGKTIEIFVHSVLQTSTGRMIFGRPKTEETETREDEDLQD